MPDYLTADEVAKYLRVSTMTVYRLIRSGQLRASRVGRNYRIAPDALAAYMSRQRGEVLGGSDAPATVTPK